jgi:NADH-ubiquinone oxidoreductase chain 5
LNIPNSSKYSYYISNENNLLLLLPIIILAILSIFIGYFTKDLYLGLGISFNSLFTHPNNLSLIETEFNIPLFLKLLPIILSLFITLFLLIMYEYFYQFIPNYNIT